MRLEISEPLTALVKRQYEQAKQNHSLIFSETELTTIRTSSGVPFQLRYCPALSRKPKQDDKPKDDKPKPDPFIDPPDDLFIADVHGPNDVSHILVLNKYPVIAEHFILATKTNKPQTGVLEPDDVEAAFACLKEWERHGNGRRLFAFFNSGEHSGASQPHRHLQFLPVESIRHGDEDKEWDLLADVLTSTFASTLPFLTFSASLPNSPTVHDLHTIYTTLLAKAVVADSKRSAAPPASREAVDGVSGPAPISYNMAMTTSSMVIAPRRSEGIVLRSDAGDEVGYVALNGTILGGTLMVKLKEEWDVLRGSPSVLDSLLEHIGVPTVEAHGNDSEKL